MTHCKSMVLPSVSDSGIFENIEHVKTSNSLVGQIKTIKIQHNLETRNVRIGDFSVDHTRDSTLVDTSEHP